MSYRDRVLEKLLDLIQFDPILYRGALDGLYNGSETRCPYTEISKIKRSLNIRKANVIQECVSRIMNTDELQKVGNILHFLDCLNDSAVSTESLSITKNVNRQSMTISQTSTKTASRSVDKLVTTSKNVNSSMDGPNLKSLETTLSGPHTGKLMHEQQLIRDSIFVMQNLDGHYIKWNDANDKYELVGNVKCNICDKSMANKICFMGFLVRQIQEFSEEKMHDEKYGMIGNALLLSIQAELHAYLQEVGIASISQNKFTLRNLSLMFHNWVTKLRFLGYLVYNLKEKKGGEILTALNTVLQHGNPIVHVMYLKIINATSRPFMFQIDNWIYEGKLHDPNSEFFITADLRVPVESLWFKRYRISNSMIPSFLKPTEAQKILLIGKSINFLREVCQQPLYDFMSPMTDYTKCDENLNAAILSRIQETYESTSTRLLHVMTTEYKLNLHFKAMRKYMLLGQGDFVRHLLDVLESELNKPAASLYKRNLSEQLITAIQCTNAQYDDDDVLRCLDVRLHEINPGDVGWDVFSLDYTVFGPLSTIFPRDVMRQYIRVFNFLLRAKRMEYNLNHLWGRMTATSKLISRILPETTEIFHLANLIATEMSFFVNQLQYYINFEILECSWATLEEKLHDSKDLDELIAAHMDFLMTLNEGCLLSDHLWNNLKDLRSIFDQIVRFETKVYKVILEESEDEGMRRKFNLKRELDQEEIERRKVFNLKLSRHKNKIGTVRQTYQDMIRDFLGGLTKSTESNLRCLSWRLDFNNFYKESRF